MKNSNRAVLAVNALVKALVGAVIMGLPLILGSWWAVVPFACYIPIIVIRTLDE